MVVPKASAYNTTYKSWPKGNWRELYHNVANGINLNLELSFSVRVFSRARHGTTNWSSSEISMTRQEPIST